MILPFLIAALWLGGIAAACRWAGMCWMRTLLTTLLMPIIQYMGGCLMMLAIWMIAACCSFLISVAAPDITGFSDFWVWIYLTTTISLSVFTVLWFSWRHFRDERDSLRDHGPNSIRGGTTTLGIHQHDTHPSIRYHGSAKKVKSLR